MSTLVTLDDIKKNCVISFKRLFATDFVSVVFNGNAKANFVE